MRARTPARRNHEKFRAGNLAAKHSSPVDEAPITAEAIMFGWSIDRIIQPEENYQTAAPLPEQRDKRSDLPSAATQ